MLAVAFDGVDEHLAQLAGVLSLSRVSDDGCRFAATAAQVIYCHVLMTAYRAGTLPADLFALHQRGDYTIDDLRA